MNEHITKTNTYNENTILFMNQAIAMAKKAEELDEVPIGCVIVKDGVVVGFGHNLREQSKDATMHAEIMAIHNACKNLDSWRLLDCDLYVTLEPCPMCAGAILQARIKNVYFGAFDQKAGCCGSLYNLLEDGRFNHTTCVYSGILEHECVSLLKDYFKKKRH